MTIINEIEDFFETSPLAFMKTVPFKEIIFDSRCKFLCKYGCKNYNRKYCCPPDSLQLAKKIQQKNYNWALLAATTSPLPDDISQFKRRFLNRKRELEIQRISSTLGTFFKEKNIEHIVLSGGACKKCLRCSKGFNEVCKKPDLKLTSMEAVGIDCQKTLSSAGFDFEMPANNSINRCTAILFDNDDLSIVNLKKYDSYQSAKKINHNKIEATCKLLQEQNSQMLESVQLIPVSEINRENFNCDEKCAHYSKNFACPPYSDKINFELWNHCVLWKWKKNSTKKSSYNQALRKIHTTLFSLGLYFAFSIRDCFCDECPHCEHASINSPICNFRKIMSPSMQSQGINPDQFGKGKYGLELL